MIYRTQDTTFQRSHVCHKKYVMKELSPLELELHRENTCPAESSIELLFIMGNVGAFPLFL